MAFDRVVELFVKANDAPNLGLEISNLDMTFDIKRSNQFSDNVAKFTVFNAEEFTRNEILIKGSNLIFNAGYVDEGVSTIYIGNITEANSYPTSDGWQTDITSMSIRSANQPLAYVTVSLSYNNKVLLSKIIKDLANEIGLVLIGAENANINLPNGWVYAGGLRGALKYCQNILKDNDAALYIDNTQVVVYRTANRDSKFSVLLLDYDSGLKSVKDITETNETDNENTKDKKPKTPALPPEKRIAFDAILIPKMQPNGLIKITTPKIDGVFLVENINFKGDNMAGAFDCSGEAVE